MGIKTESTCYVCGRGNAELALIGRDWDDQSYLTKIEKEMHDLEAQKESLNELSQTEGMDYRLHTILNDEAARKHIPHVERLLRIIEVNGLRDRSAKKTIGEALKDDAAKLDASLNQLRQKAKLVKEEGCRHSWHPILVRKDFVPLPAKEESVGSWQGVPPEKAPDRLANIQEEYGTRPKVDEYEFYLCTICDSLFGHASHTAFQVLHRDVDDDD